MAMEPQGFSRTRTQKDGLLKKKKPALKKKAKQSCGFRLCSSRGEDGAFGVLSVPHEGWTVASGPKSKPFIPLFL